MERFLDELDEAYYTVRASSLETLAPWRLRLPCHNRLEPAFAQSDRLCFRVSDYSLLSSFPHMTMPALAAPDP